ncbi:MAG: hypothetical protein ACKVWV_14195 [Planctomycetota bacterium]
MGQLQQYRRKETTTVVAVKFDLDLEGFTYSKWGGEQRCKRGDWLVDNGGDVYTVDADTFARTYREVSRGVYEKVGTVWAEQASSPGTIRTKEGSTDYAAGDYLVFNDPQRKDGYAIAAAKFAQLYTLVR